MKKPLNSGEKIYLETDRSLYCVNEKIFFVAKYQCIGSLKDLTWSNILYVELIRWNGEKIVQAKFKLTKNDASGYLIIPGNIPSGNYYLRGYTKWMRNFPVEKYAYRKIKIINPFENSIDPGEMEQTGVMANTNISGFSQYFEDIRCTTNKNSYKTREKIELAVELNNSRGMVTDYCLTVAKKGSIDTNYYEILFPENVRDQTDTLTYLPEIRGISVSGKVENDATRKSIEGIRVNLSMPLSYKYFSTFFTKSNGNFYFTIPEYFGAYDFYIDAKTKNGEKANILINSDYCNRNVHLAYIPFFLNENERTLALEMSIDMQLSEKFNNSNEDKNDTNSTIPFYGSANSVYYTAEYVDLPNLEEFFFEIIWEVRVIKRKDGSYLKLVEKNEFVNLEPLILVDNVPVENGSGVLKIPLIKIEKVEIIDKPYIAANTRFNGAICIYTKNKDFAGIDLNKNSVFFRYGLLSRGIFNSPDHGSDSISRKADRRNLLFWEPNIGLMPGQIKTLSFYASDSKGKYTVFIRSLRNSSDPQLYGICEFVVE